MCCRKLCFVIFSSEEPENIVVGKARLTVPLENILLDVQTIVNRQSIDNLGVGHFHGHGAPNLRRPLYHLRNHFQSLVVKEFIPFATLRARIYDWNRNMATL